MLVGAIDVATDTIETPEQVAATLRAALKHVAPEHLYGCTNCGMAPMARGIAEAKLRSLAAGAAIVRKEVTKKG
ncbi:2-hydroxypropyl-CoM lyase [compost metagenome]